MLTALALPVTVNAQDAPAPPQKQAPEIGVYVYHVDGAKRFIRAGGKMIAEARDFAQFVAMLGGTPEETPGRRANEDQWNAAVLNVLSRQGWHLLGCQWFERADSYTYMCHFKRDA
jgi:hypothetical protein